MLMASMPIAVIMQRRAIQHRWMNEVWAAVGVVPDGGGLPRIQPLNHTEEHEHYLVSGLQLELYPDENEGYFENWIAPEPKVFVMWRMENARAMPVIASVSYAEGTRMFDSGESADGVPMSGDIHQWLAEYLNANYQPRPRRGREHG